VTKRSKEEFIKSTTAVLRSYVYSQVVGFETTCKSNKAREVTAVSGALKCERWRNCTASWLQTSGRPAALSMSLSFSLLSPLSVAAERMPSVQKQGLFINFVFRRLHYF